MSYYDDEEDDPQINAIAGRVVGVYIVIIGLLIYKMFL